MFFCYKRTFFIPGSCFLQPSQYRPDIENAGAFVLAESCALRPKTLGCVPVFHVTSVSVSGPGGVVFGTRRMFRGGLRPGAASASLPPPPLAPLCAEWRSCCSGSRAGGLEEHAKRKAQSNCDVFSGAALPNLP